jgi:malate dehydrogenase (oxaloacetate-decarboxylating)
MSNSTATTSLPSVLEDPLRNRGVALTATEREALGLTSRPPAAVPSQEEQAGRVYEQLRHQL